MSQKELTKEEIETQNKWIEIQENLKKSLIEIDDFKFKIIEKKENDNDNDNDNGDSNGEFLKYIGGVDISFVKDNDVDACASLIVLEYPSLKIVYKDIEFIKLKELYIPGFLAFRETPYLVNLIDRLKQSTTNNHLVPQILMIDGNGILHPRGFGLASHLGILVDIPTIGVGKTFFHVDGLSTKEIKLKVENERLNSLTNNSTSSTTKSDNQDDDININIPLKGESGRIWGSAILSNSKCKNPIYVSVGHRISLESSLKVVKLISPHRVPEPIRQADLLSRDYIRLNYNKYLNNNNNNNS